MNNFLSFLITASDSTMVRSNTSLTNVVFPIITLIIGFLLRQFIPPLFKWIRRFTPIRNKIKKNIEIGINNEFHKLIKETCAIPVLSGGIKIEWQETFEKEKYLNEEGDIVVKLSYSNDKNLSRCFTKSLMLYLDDAFMSETKPFIGAQNYEGCKFTIAKEFLFTRDTISYRHFISDYLTPRILSDSLIEKLLNKLDSISKRMLFRTVLLHEIYSLCGSGNIPNPEMRSEVSDFIGFLWNIANKEKYEMEEKKEPPLFFRGRYIKVQVTLIKRPGTGDISPHVKACEMAFEKGANRVYITGWGSENVVFTREAANSLSEKGLKCIGDLSYDVEISDGFKPGVCF